MSIISIIPPLAPKSSDFTTLTPPPLFTHVTIPPAVSTSPGWQTKVDPDEGYQRAGKSKSSRVVLRRHKKEASQS